MQISINYETLGFLVPSSISAKMASTDQLVTLSLEQLSADEIGALCDEFRDKVFKMANTEQPTQQVSQTYRVGTICDSKPSTGPRTINVFSFTGPVGTPLNFESVDGVKYLPPMAPVEPAWVGAVFQGYIVDSSHRRTKLYSSGGASMYSPGYYLSADDKKFINIPPVPTLPTPPWTPAEMKYNFQEAIRNYPVTYSTDLDIHGDYREEKTAMAFYAWQVAKGYRKS